MVKLGIVDKLHKELWGRQIRKATFVLIRIELLGT